MKRPACRLGVAHCRGAEARKPIGRARSGAAMIKTLSAPPPTIRRPSVARYLRALAMLLLECADRPELLSDLMHILACAPRTIAALRSSERRRAA